MARAYLLVLGALLACRPQPVAAPAAAPAAKGADPVAAPREPPAVAEATDDRLLGPESVDDALSKLVPPGRVQIPVAEDDAWSGAPNPTAVAVVFHDYQCPHCKVMQGTLRTLVNRYPTDVRVVLKHFPLRHHDAGMLAAQAVLAAARQGRLWAVHEELLGADALDEARILDIARRLGLAMGQFEADWRGDAVVQRLAVDRGLAADLRISGVPTVFINGREVSGAQGLDELGAIVEEERRLADTLMQAGSARQELYARIMRAARPATEPPPAPVRPGTPDPQLHYAVPVDGRPSRGDKLALVTIVEFADFQCPFSNRVRATLDAVRAEFEGDVRLVYRNLPLRFHPQARLAAAAALAAGRQGKFWKMHDRLFESQAKLSPKKIDAIAKSLRLNLKRFRRDLKSPAIEKKIRDDEAVAQRFGARGTPSFFINGRFLSGARPVQQFNTLVREELDRAKKFRKAHKAAPDTNIYDSMIATFEPSVAGADG